MKISIKIAFVGYLLVALLFALNGIVYLVANQVMPYHQEAMGGSWNSFSTGVQVMSLNFMKAAGAGMITTSISILFLLFIPFKKGEVWSSWAIFIIAMNEIILIFLRVIDVRSKTPGKPDFIFLIIEGFIIIVCFIISLFGMKKNIIKNNQINILHS
jgi:hypothetical protein